eukprot:GFUD01007203.1.p1 GENE.GFUD01007203.1~~GFUD01007203.1.p1  ORF type:complete len:172 (-),score=48.83 GFUD01007203.1:117-632(-)
MSTFLSLVLLSMISLITCFYLPNTKVASTCKTAENEDGKCLQITECKSLADFLEKPMSKQKIIFLKQSACGFENELPKVCCPGTNIQVKTINTQEEESTTTDEVIDTKVEETTATKEVTDVEETILGVSDEFDFSLRDGFSSEWPEPNNDDCIGENCLEENEFSGRKSEFL